MDESMTTGSSFHGQPSFSPSPSISFFFPFPMIYLFLLLLLLPSFSHSTNRVCVFNTSLPAYQPNIYLCSSTSLCCVTRQQPACCERDVSFKHVLRQSIPFVGLLIGFLLVAGIISWYYNDNEIMDDDENGDAYKKKISLKNILFPSSEEDVVDDPIFGRVWDETAPRYSRVSDRAKRVGYLVDGEETKKKN